MRDFCLVNMPPPSFIEHIKASAGLGAQEYYGAQFAKRHSNDTNLYWLQALSGLAFLWQQIPEKTDSDH